MTIEIVNDTIIMWKKVRYVWNNSHLEDQCHHDTTHNTADTRLKKSIQDAIEKSGFYCVSDNAI